MTDQVKQLTDEQLADRNLQREIRNMPSDKMIRHLKRIARKDKQSFKGTWAAVLSIVLENTKPQGKLEPFLR